MVYQIKGDLPKYRWNGNIRLLLGGGDTHYSVMHGTKCDLVIKQGAEENFMPTLYVENIKGEQVS